MTDTLADGQADDRDDLAFAVRLVVDLYRACLEDDATALARRLRLEPDTLAMAGLAHACMLLEELMGIDHLVRRAGEVVPSRQQVSTVRGRAFEP
jgi:hypothetical protein